MPVVKIIIQKQPEDTDEAPRVFNMNLPNSMYYKTKGGDDWLAPFIEYIKDYTGAAYF